MGCRDDWPDSDIGGQKVVSPATSALKLRGYERTRDGAYLRCMACGSVVHDADLHDIYCPARSE